MKAKCPGQQRFGPTDSIMVECPSCGEDVELFSDEAKRRCRCGGTVTRESIPKCAEWCPAAQQCFGKAADVRVLKARVEAVKNDPKAKECLQRIQRLLSRRQRNGDRR
ncbi:MAG TPA: hypothetical protein VM695_16570 [Phycisphaerae bacterium]|nr:hypothetical protein [Phycisphaerae bacterium]